MGMCFQKFVKLFILLFLLPLAGCEVIDSFIPSTGTYRVNAFADNILLDDFSIIKSGTKIQPYFEEEVSDDPDVTALVVYLNNKNGEITGWKVIYMPDNDYIEPEQIDDDADGLLDDPVDEDSLNDDSIDDDEGITELSTGQNNLTTVPDNTERYTNGDELIIKVRSLDEDLPYFPIPSDLPVGRYTIVFQVMSQNQILHKSEKDLYNLSNINFSFTGIHVHQSNVPTASQLITRGSVVMFEAVLDFDDILDPYIVWYNGRDIISEGKISDGAGAFLFQAPEQAGFFSISAEVFPVTEHNDLMGYVREISILVSSRNTTVYLVSVEDTELLHWYTFEGNLNNSKTADNSLIPTGDFSPRWMAADGAYGLVTGQDAYMLPVVNFSNNDSVDNNLELDNNWKIKFRFKPLDDGIIFSVYFGPLFNVRLVLSANIPEGMAHNSFALSLISSNNDNTTGANIITTVGKNINIPEEMNPDEAQSFLTAEVYFSVLPDKIMADMSIIYDTESSNSDEFNDPLFLDAVLDKEFRTILGSYTERINTVIWNELALLANLPKIEVTDKDQNIETPSQENLPQLIAAQSLTETAVSPSLSDQTIYVTDETLPDDIEYINEDILLENLSEEYREDQLESD